MIDYKSYFNMDLEVEEMFKSVVYKLLETLRAEREEGVTEYFSLPEKSLEIVDRVKRLEEERDIFQCASQVVVVGLGGSSLGAKAIDSILRGVTDAKKEIIFLDNPDPLYILDSFSKIEKSRAIFIIISKSGITVETISIFKALLKEFGFKLPRKSAKFLVVTDKNSPLDRFATDKGISTFHIPDRVGGRFSVFSAVGIVPLTLAGYDTKEILNGARDFLERFWDKRELHILEKALFLSTNREQFHTNLIFSYSSYLEDFNKWYVQLWAESLGKIDRDDKNRVGLTPISMIGAVDQHSFLQLLMEGPKDKSVSFIKIDSFIRDVVIPDISLEHIKTSDFVNGYTLGELLNRECEATLESLRSLDIPLDVITLDELSYRNIGELIIYYELLTSAVGTLLNVNTYNQPGVELGKKILREKFKS